MSKDRNLPDLSGLVARARQESGAKDVKDERGGIDRMLEAALLLSALQRWMNETGELPTEDDWDQDPSWPAIWKVKKEFGSWDRMIHLSGLQQSMIGKKLADAASEREQFQRTTKARLAELNTLQSQMQEREREAAARTLELNAQARTSAQRVRDAEKQQAMTAKELARAQHLVASAQSRVAVVERQLADKDDEIVRLQALVSSLKPANVLWSSWLTGSSAIDVGQARTNVTELLTDVASDVELLASSTTVSQEIGLMNAVVISDVTVDRSSWSLIVTDRQDQPILDVAIVSTGSGVELGVRAHSDAGSDLGVKILLRWAGNGFLVDGDSGWKITEQPTVIHGGRAEDWVYARLGDPKRRLPVLAIASEVKGINRSDIAREMVGLADVAFLADAEASWLITEKFSKEWSVFGTAIRVYWPDLNFRDGDPFNHPLWIVSPDRYDIEEALSAVRGRIEDWSAVQPWGTYVSSSQAADDTTMSAKLHEITDRLHETENRLADAQRKNHEMRQRIAALTEEPDLESDAHDRSEIRKEFTTVLEATRRASADATALKFADAAFTSAEDSPFTRPSQIYETLMRLDTVASDYLVGESGRSVRQTAEALGLRWSNAVSSAVVARHSRHYTYVWDGHKLEMGPHVAIGSGRGANSVARIYLTIVDGGGDLDRAIIVGHVGRHLPDSTT